MNPAIHHPSWYQAIGAADDASAQKAASQPDMIVLQQLARIRLGPLDIQCLPEQWRVSSASERDEGAAIELTVKVFEALNHTPVHAFGLNYIAQNVLEHATPQSLASHFAGSPLSPQLDSRAAEFESVTLGYELDALPEIDGCSAERRFRSHVSILTKPKRILRIAINVHHNIASRNGFARFDLGRFLRDAVSVRPMVQSHIDAILQRVASL